MEGMKPSDKPDWAVMPEQPNCLFLCLKGDSKDTERHCLDDRDCFWIGRNPAVCQFSYQHKSISRMHAQLVHRGKV